MFRFGDPGGRMYVTAGTSQVNILSYWSLAWAGTQSSWSVSSTNGRLGTSSLRVSVGSSYPYALFKVLDAQATWGIAFAFRTGTIGTGGACLCTFNDAGTNTNSQINLVLNIDGTLSIVRGASGTVLGTTAAQAVFANTYVHLELLVTIHPSAGTAQLWVNGVSKINLSSVNTRSTANSTANIIGIGTITGNYASTNWDYDDVIVYDGATTDANGFTDIHGQIGDCGLVWLLPTGAGTTTQFTPDTGSNYARVNEATPDGDTSYVGDSTVTDIDTYAMADLAGTAATVKSVASIHYARKDDVGSRGIEAELRSGGGNTAHATAIVLGNSYQYYFSNWGQNPNNGSAANWTVSTVNALEAGQMVSS